MTSVETAQWRYFANDTVLACLLKFLIMRLHIYIIHINQAVTAPSHCREGSSFNTFTIRDVFSNKNGIVTCDLCLQGSL